MSDKERALTPKAFRLTSETADRLKSVAALIGKSQRQTITQAIHELADRVRAEPPRSSRGRGHSPKPR